MVRSIIITVDTEGDNLWNWHPGTPITTRNSHYVDRFQLLCDEYGFKPVYLVNYEMLENLEFISRLRQWEAEGRCEIGLHIHAWNNPPIRPLATRYNGQDYLIEYPEETMRKKFDTIYSLYVQRVGHDPLSHRAGRWAMDDRYFKILSDYNIKVDCSYTPGINWESSIGVTKGGSDYSGVPECSHFVGDVLEVPMTVRQGRAWGKGSFMHNVKSLLVKHPIMLRPSGHSSIELQVVLDQVTRDTGCDYAEFMIHSSELMPGGSPYFRDADSVEVLYRRLDKLFNNVLTLGFKGATLKEYYQSKVKKLS